MQKKILINGAFGRMGQLTCATLEKHPEFSIVAKIGRHDDFATTIQAHQPDIIIDFTNADCVWENVQTILKHDAAFVIGTSGLKKDQIDSVLKTPRKQGSGGIIVPNFSIGAILQMRCAEEIARYFTKAEIIEIHHEKKLDAPSGTAVRTAEGIQKIIEASKMNVNDVTEGHTSQGRQQDQVGTCTPPGNVADTHQSHESRYCIVPIHSARLPGFVAEQEVIFGADAESLSISHKVLNREAYMPGLVLACQQVMTFERVYYGLEFCLQG